MPPPEVKSNASTEYDVIGRYDICVRAY